ncbi:armadillo-type protein, partial [Aspergillus floccosus]
MSLLPPEVHSALSQLLRALSTPDNAVRAQAEDQLNNDWIQNRPDVLLMGLAEQIQGAEEVVTRTFSAVLFRRIATKTRKDPVTNEAKELFSTLSGEQRLVIREKLVTCLTSESTTDVRKKIGDAVAEIARQYTDNGDQWPELLGVLFQASQSPDAGLREAAYRIFSTTPGIIERPHEDAVTGVFSKGFKDDNIA